MTHDHCFLHDWTFPAARGVVAIVHGYAEHGGRYAPIAQTLRHHRIAAIAADLRGHGRSPGRRGHVDRFDDYRADVLELLRAARRRCPESPIFVLAHSMGGLIALDLLASGADLGVAGVVLSSPLLGLARPISKPTHWFLSVLARIWPSCPLPSGLDAALVCRDPEHGRDYAHNPLIFRRTTARWVVEAERAIRRVHEGRFDAMPPLLLLMAGDDRVVSAAATRRFAARHGLADCVVEFPDYFHEILNEPAEQRQPVIDRIAAWLSTHAGHRGDGTR